MAGILQYAVILTIATIVAIVIFAFLDQPKPMNTSPKEYSMDTGENKCVSGILVRSDSIIIIKNGETVKC